MGVAGCLVLENLEGVEVLLGQDVVHADQPLAELDVKPAIPQARLQDPLS